MSLAASDKAAESAADAAINDALERVLGSEVFADVPRLSRFLEFVVLETLSGRGDRLKGFVIACEVFDKTDPSDAQTTTIVRVEAGRLRRRLDDYYQGPGSTDPLRISMPKGGYKPHFEEVAGKEQAPTQAGEQAQQQGGTPGPTGSRWLLPLVLLAAVVAGFALLERGPDSDPAGEGHRATSTLPTLAILPMEAFNRSQGNDGLGLAITDSLIRALSKQGGLQVMALSSTNYYRSEVNSARDIARDLDVSHVITGGYYQTGESLDVSVALHDGSSGYILWSEQFSVDTEARQLLSQRILEGVSNALGIGSAELFPSNSEFDADLYTLYAQARDLSHPPANKLRVSISLDMFESLMAAYPDFAGAYSGAAYARAAMVWWQHSEQPEADKGTATAHARQALQMDPGNGMAYLSLGMLAMAEADHDQALSMMRRAVEVQPSNSLALSILGTVELWTGHGENSVNRIQEAIRLDPLNRRAPYWNLLGAAYFHGGNYAEAAAAFRMNNEKGGPRAAVHDHYLAAALVGAGQLEEAQEFLRERFGNRPAVDWLPWHARNFADDVELAKLTSKLEVLGLDVEN